MPDFTNDILEAIAKVNQDLGGAPQSYLAYVPYSLIDDFLAEMGYGWKECWRDEHGVTFECPVH